MDGYCALQSPLRSWQLANKKVFVRIDANVPLKDGVILDDYRLQAVRPTLDYILQHGGNITLATHLGRPHTRDAALSTNIIKQWLQQHGYDNRITVLENLRFSEKEYYHSDSYAKELARGMDYYIDDAFASVHDDNASLTALPEQFDAQHKGIGFLIERELAALCTIKYHAKKPFVAILGGGKPEKKLAMIAGLIPRVTDIMLCPALATPFVQLMHPPLNPSTPLRMSEEIHEARTILTLAQQHGVTIHVPQDYLVKTGSWDGNLTYKIASAITADDTMIAIGPKTVALWAPIIKQAQTIFFNGPMGYLEQPETVRELQAVLQVITQSNAMSVVGGGNSHAALQFFGLADKISFCSTGGGATLAYLADQDLPALDALL